MKDTLKFNHLMFSFGAIFAYKRYC